MHLLVRLALVFDRGESPDMALSKPPLIISRVYSRAFIIGSTTNPEDRFVYLVIDTAMGDTAIRYGILQGLANLGSAYSMYNQSNVAVTGTHQHSGPGAWLNYLLPQVTSLGFSKQSYQAIVDGSVLSIQRAHESLAPGTLSYADTNITDANINRSLYAYLQNPAAERAQYDTSTDTILTMLRFKRASDGLNTGVLCWHRCVNLFSLSSPANFVEALQLLKD
jgi:neutral ceramidase